MVLEKADMIKELQAEILRMQGFKTASNKTKMLSLGPLRHSFPNATFPIGCIHEVLSQKIEDSAASSGFVAGLLSTLMGTQGNTLWISATRKLFPPALKIFGLEPDRFIFIDVKNEADVLWAMNEALKCSAISAVVGEMREITFTESRRLQLAVEESQATGFILRNAYRNLNTTACVTRWKVTPLPSEIIDGLPGIGFPKWRVELLRVRNGRPGAWDIGWADRKFRFEEATNSFTIQNKKAG